MHKIILVGNLGKDIEEKVTPRGMKLLTFSLAVTVKKGQVAWYDCNIWEKRRSQFEGKIPYLKKGSKVIVIGDLHIPDIYQDKQGNAKIKLKIDPISIDFPGTFKEEKEPKDELKEMGLF